MSREINFYRKREISNSLIEKLKGFKELESETLKLEDSIKDRLSVEYAITTSSATSALHLGMCALDLKRGDKILCSVNSFVNVPEVVRHFDAEPIFVDIDQRTYNLDLKSLEKKIKENKTKKLRAVIVSHTAGLASDIDSIKEIATKHNLKVVEDCSDALGAKFNGVEVGSSSDLAVIDFGDKFAKDFIGGALLTNSKEYATRAELLRNHSLINQSISASYLYDVVDIGCDYRMSDYNSLFAQEIFENIDRENQRRAEIAKIYKKELQGLKHITLPVDDPNHLYRYFIIEIDKNRDGFARELKARGVEVALHYVPLHMTKYYKDKYNLKIFDFSNAMNVYQRVMSLPNHLDLSDDDILYVCQKIREVDAIHI
jgi:dTDP-4-amino-4,6-dideoxygalactose transaminase